MKYWLLTTEFPPQYGGGIGTYCYQWCTLLHNHKHLVTVFIPDKNEKLYREKFHNNIRVVHFSPYLENTSSILGYETMISYSFAKIVEIYMLKEGVPDWVESQEYNGIAYYILQKKHLHYPLFRDLKVLITCHCPSFITFEHNHINTFQLPYFWIGEMERFCMKAADHCISPSKYLMDNIHIKYPGLVEHFSVLHNPYHPNHVADKKRELLNEVLVIGKLSPAKGILQTLKTFDKLWSKGFPYKLKLIGDQNYFYHAAGTTTEVFIKKKYGYHLKSGMLIIAGMVDPENLQTEIDQANIILVPSTVENLPYTVIEGMSKGKIVVASDQGGQRELITDGVNGFLFNNDDVHSLENKLQFASSLPGDKRLVIGAEAEKVIVEKCDPQNYYFKKMELLNNVVPASNETFPFIKEKQINHGDDQSATNELLSVIIPFYNMGIYIDDTIQSIYASDYKHLEIIIVNDGSTERESIKKLEQLAEKGIKIIHQSNQGLAAARNYGAKEAAGQFLAFLDADDMISNTYYSKAIEVLQCKSNVSFVGCWVQYFGESKNQWPSFNPEPPYILFHNMVNSSGLVYKRESFLKAGLNDSRFIYGMEDYDSVLNLIEHGYRGVVIPEFHFYYRVRKNSMARGFNKSNMAYLYQLLIQKHEKIYTEYATDVANLLNVNGPGYQYENPTLDYHIHPGNSIYNRFMRKLKVKVKQQPFLRKVALSIYQKLKP